MNSFVDREHELQKLEALYAHPESRLLIVYGRRRLGKTALLGRFAKSKPFVYYMADRATEVSQRNAFARAAAESLDEPLLAQIQYKSWYDVFAALDRVRKLDGKLIVILDEYQYLCQVQPAFSSFIQKWWDEQWKQNRILLILCGSLTSMMYRETLSRSSPLYGRSDGQILLRPLPYPCVRSFVHTPTEERCMERYAVAGGVPRYLEILSEFDDFDSVLRQGILEPTAPLHAEARYLLQDEIDVPNTCWSLLEAIASGATRISELASRLKQPASNLTRYLALLRDLSIIEREVPVRESNPAKSKRGIYTINDPFLRLWFGCVYPYESFFEIHAMDAVQNRIAPRIRQHIQYCYEFLCRQYARECLAPQTNTVKIGRQWGAHYEIDLLGLDPQNRVSLAGESKWSLHPVGLSVLRQLQDTVTTQKLPLAAECRWLLFSRSGFSDDLKKHAATRPNLHLIQSIFSR